MKGIKTPKMDISKLNKNLYPNTFKVITSQTVLEIFQSFESGIKTIRRIIKRKGSQKKNYDQFQASCNPSRHYFRPPPKKMPET